MDGHIKTEPIKLSTLREGVFPSGVPYPVESEPVLDPLGDAARRLFGLSYLFPYQRLVVTNILEAAEAAGMKVRWPEPPEMEKPGAAKTTPAGNTAPKG